MKIITQLRIGIAMLLAFSILSAASVFFQLGQMGHDGMIVDYAGRQRALSQRIAALASLKYQGLDTEAEMNETMVTLEKVIKGLINGDRDLHLPKAENRKFLGKMHEVETLWAKYKETVEKALEGENVLKDLYADSQNVLKAAEASVIVAAEMTQTNVRTLKIIQVVVVVLNLALLAAILLMSRKKITEPLEDLSGDVEKISTGDLRVEVAYAGDDEIGGLARDMKRMVGSLKVMIHDVLASADNVASTVHRLRGGSEKAAEGARSQSVQADQIATAAEEMSKTIVDIARNASAATETSSKAMETASKGKDLADGAVDTVNKVYTSTVELATMVEKVNRRAAEIGDIVTVIKDIADQTNLLALNAAIEAARAGEDGRGFAVVADEVRKLAERTIRATSEISDKIGTVQTESDQTMKSMSEASEEVTRATDYIRQVGASLKLIVEAVQGVRDQITQIAAAVEEQSAASEEVARNIEKTSTTAHDMEKMSGEVMNEVSGLARIAEALKRATAGFKVQ